MEQLASIPDEEGGRNKIAGLSWCLVYVALLELLPCRLGTSTINAGILRVGSLVFGSKCGNGCSCPRLRDLAFSQFALNTNKIRYEFLCHGGGQRAMATI